MVELETWDDDGGTKTRRDWAQSDQAKPPGPMIIRPQPDAIMCSSTEYIYGASCQ